MSRDLIKFASSLAVNAGLLAIYLVFLGRCVALSNWSHLSSLETGILVTQIIRLGFVLGLSKFFRPQPLFAVILLSMEVFTIPFLAVLTIWTGNQIYTTWIGGILTTWIGVTSILLSPYAIYEFAKSMVKSSSLASVLAIGTFELAGMLFLYGAIAFTSSGIQGPSALGAAIIQLGRTQISSSALGGIASSDAIAVGLVVFSVGMMIYLTLGERGTGTQVKLSNALLVLLGGAALALLWMFGMLSVSSDELLAFTIPTVIGAAAIWGSARGR